MYLQIKAQWLYARHYESRWTLGIQHYLADSNTSERVWGLLVETHYVPLKSLFSYGTWKPNGCMHARIESP
jgi:hypothetical protein